jgi:hypothetical protein
MSQFRRVYPGKGRILFDGGMNNKFERSIILDNESPDCLNVVFSNGAVETREGTTKLNTAAVGSFVFDGLYTRRADDNSETMVAFAGGHMFTLAGTSFSTVPSAQSVFTAGFRVATTQYENKMFMGNGGVIPYKWDGTYFTRHGVYPPTATASAGSAATGAALASGSSYTYKFTYVNSFSVEGDLGPATTHVVTVNSMGNVALTSIPVAPQSFGISARRIYRTEAGGSTFKRVTEIANNTTTTYDDAVLDGSLGVTAPSDNGVPPNYSVCIYHQNRLWVNDPANPNYAWYSELGEPYTFQSTNFRKFGDASSDLVKGFSIQDNSVVIHTERGAGLVYMPSTDDSTWVDVKIKTPYGTKSPFGVVNFNGKQLYPAMENDKFIGFAALSGAAVDPSSTLLTVSNAGSDLKTDRIETDMFDVVETYVGNISGIIYKNKAYLSLTYGSGSTTNNRIYVMDFSISNLAKTQKEAWVPWTGLNAAQFTIYGGNLYYASSTATGFVYRMEAGVYSDDGAAINSYYWTKEFSGADSEYNDFKDFRYVNLLVENSGDWFMNFAYRVDSDSGDGSTQQLDLDPGSSLWGTMVWGSDTWGGGSDQEENRIYLATARGKRIQFKFSNQNTAGQKFKVHGLSFAYNLKGYR